MNLQSQIELMKDPGRFSRLVINLLGQEYLDYQAIDDDRGDGGNDGYLQSEKRIFARHCFKKLPKRDLDNEILKKIKSDFAKAVKLKVSGKYEVENWTFITNYSLSNDVVEKMRTFGKAANIQMIHQGAGYVAGLALNV
jgi:hypothetical protein